MKELPNEVRYGEGILLNSVQNPLWRVHLMHLRHSIKAVIFDFDGTLAVLNIDFSLMRDRLFELIRKFGVREDSIKEPYLLEIIDEVYPILQKESFTQAETFYKEAHRILHDIELKAAEEGRMIPGTKETLKVLKSLGVKVGIITRNCEEAVRKIFPDLDHYCDVFISRDSIRKVKPHPDHLQAALKTLNVTGEESVMVGDHTIDILAGKRVGMKTVGVLTGRITKDEFKEAGATFILNDASEICLLFQEGGWREASPQKLTHDPQGP